MKTTFSNFSTAETLQTTSNQQKKDTLPKKLDFSSLKAKAVALKMKAEAKKLRKEKKDFSNILEPEQTLVFDSLSASSFISDDSTLNSQKIDESYSISQISTISDFDLCSIENDSMLIH